MSESDEALNHPLFPGSRNSSADPGGVPARPGGAPPGGKELSVGGIAVGFILRAVRRHLLLFGAVAGFLTTAAYLAFRSPPLYRASAVVRLAGDRRALGAGVEAASPELDRASGPVLSLVPRLRSRTVAGMVVDTLGLQLQPVGVSPALTGWLFATGPVVELSGVRVDPDTPSDTLYLSFNPDDLVARRGQESVRVAYGVPVHIGPAHFTVPPLPATLGAVVSVVPRDVAIDRVLLQLAIVPLVGTDALEVKYTDPSPVHAQQVANLIVGSFLATTVRGSQNQAKRRALFLAAQLRETDSLLRRAQGRLSGFRSRQPMGTASDKLGLQQAALMSLDSRRGELEADRRVFQSLLNQLESADDSARAEGLRTVAYSPEIASDIVVRNLYEQLLAYRTRLDSMTTGPFRSAPDNPDVVQLRDLLASSQQELVRAVRAHLESVNQRTSALTDLRSSNEGQVQALPGRQAEELRLDQQVASLSTLDDQLRLEYQKARMSEQLQAADVDVVDMASRPYLPVGVPWWLKAGLAMVLGCLAGAGTTTVVELRDRSIRAPEEMERVMHVRGLGIIPKVEEPVSVRLAPGSLAGIRDRLTDGVRATEPPGSAVAEVGGSGAPGVEAFRLLWTNLTFGWGNRHRTILVTSVGPQEGKTLVATNLALAFAREGARVLLVDCDVRRPRLHKMFRVSRAPGLMEMLNPGGEQQADSVAAEALSASPPLKVHGYSLTPNIERPDEHSQPPALAEAASDLAPNAALFPAASAKSTSSNGTPSHSGLSGPTPPDPELPYTLPRNIRKTAMKGLYVLPCGTIPVNPTLALKASSVRTVLHVLSEHFDVIIVDTPPVLVSADAPILAPLADDVLMVVRAGETNRDDLEEASRHLAAAGAHVVGAVLNDPAGEVARSRGRYYAYEYPGVVE